MALKLFCDSVCKNNFVSRPYFILNKIVGGEVLVGLSEFFCLSGKVHIEMAYGFKTRQRSIMKYQKK
jgi:hypothetical protein